jgi:hypothetical protein
MHPGKQDRQADSHTGSQADETDKSAKFLGTEADLHALSRSGYPDICQDV